MDNLTARRGRKVGRLFDLDLAEARYLPVYSPDHNPIELMFSKLKIGPRKVSERTVDELS